MLPLLLLLARAVGAEVMPASSADIAGEGEAPVTVAAPGDPTPEGAPAPAPRFASDVEVGRTRRLGVGVAAGYPPSVTLKAFFDRRNAVVVHLGTTLGISGLQLRLQFEQSARSLRRWDFGELFLTWNAGVLVDFIFGQQTTTTTIRPGITAGVGAELRLTPAPVAAFGELSPILYPFDLAAQEETAFFPVGVTLVVGARWYF